MAQSKYNLSNTKPAFQQPRTIFLPINGKENDDWDELNVGQLGNPVYSNLTFDAKTYIYNDKETTVGELVINSVIISVSQSKNIVKTSIQGRSGTVKEYICDGDFSISVDGQIIDPDALVYPEKRVKELVKLLNIPMELAVTSEFLLRFGIFNVVVDSYSFPQQKGSRNVQPFTLSLSSEKPLELDLKPYEAEKSTTINAKFRL
jgi:hypothetical protein